MAFTLTLSFDNIINESAQIGDIVYFTPVTPTGGSNSFEVSNTSNILELGKIIEIINPNLYSGVASSIVLLCNLYNKNTGSPITPNPNDFIMFGKDKIINNTSLLGYYAEVNFVNDSDKKIELFSVGSEIAESSK